MATGDCYYLYTRTTRDWEKHMKAQRSEWAVNQALAHTPRHVVRSTWNKAPRKGLLVSVLNFLLGK